MQDLTQKSVSPDYAHYDKVVEHDERLILGDTTLKWYTLAREVAPVPAAIDRMARSFLSTELSANRLHDLGDCGFSILHRCGDDFYFLLVNTWRNNNELWESVYAKESDAQAEFRPFPQPPLHKGTFCVWELAAVWHEQQAWKKYLRSTRDSDAKRLYLEDCYRGPA